jgi:hypothetical protein
LEAGFGYRGEVAARKDPDKQVVSIIGKCRSHTGSELCAAAAAAAAARGRGLAGRVLRWSADQAACGARVAAGRKEYVEELGQHVRVDSFGACLQNAAPPAEGSRWLNMYGEAKLEVMRGYHF